MSRHNWREGASLAKLAYLLRHRELWPAGFDWRFAYCRQCALGLAWAVWPEAFAHTDPQTSDEALRTTAAVFGLSYDVAYVTFYDAAEYGWCFGMISPEQIADRIDAHLASELELVAL